ncbi:hypothetical protein CBP36_21420 (plasmid) [Acidovorax carolinensis]|uniref:Uncharacterized protein n=1 Tax=Acidovorax carolinensis TaxID=553814 RepID=A0A240UK74_9BURK|nr:hypothetical protein [Acidovorax carolinensis]ART61526.1 hypothetical protein CBP36_21420 [Acidovorax carolinensis]
MISVEIFAAKDGAGSIQGVMLAAPVGCGLKQADTLRVHGTRLIALDNRSMLPIDLPVLNEAACKDLEAAISRGEGIVVGEFTALGLADSYLLALERGAPHQGQASLEDRQ